MPHFSYEFWMDGDFFLLIVVGRVSDTAISIGASIWYFADRSSALYAEETRNIHSPRSGGHAFEKTNSTTVLERSRKFARSGFFRFISSYHVKIDGNMGKKQCKESHFVRPGMGKPRVRFHLTGRQTAPLIDAGRG